MFLTARVSVCVGAFVQEGDKWMAVITFRALGGLRSIRTVTARVKAVMRSFTSETLMVLRSC